MTMAARYRLEDRLEVYVFSSLFSHLQFFNHLVDHSNLESYVHLIYSVVCSMVNIYQIHNTHLIISKQ
jgi:hypothetical protein